MKPCDIESVYDFVILSNREFTGNLIRCSCDDIVWDTIYYSVCNDVFEFIHFAIQNVIVPSIEEN